MEKIPHEDTIRKVLNRYGLSADFSEYKAYIDREKNGWVKLIVSVLPENGPRVVVHKNHALRGLSRSTCEKEGLRYRQPSACTDADGYDAA